MPRIYDISRTIAPTLAVWPGDTPFSAVQNLRLAAGDPVNLTTLTMTAHIGSHADAPWHVQAGGGHPADMPLEPFIGPAHVVTITRQHGGIGPTDFAGHDLHGMRRLLIHTWYSDVPDDQFRPDFPYPTVELVDWLAGQGVILLGVDMPTVDAFEGEGLPAHHRLFERGMFNLETLCLRGVPDGRYELIALPLKIAGVCGSPVRAILRALD